MQNSLTEFYNLFKSDFTDKAHNVQIKLIEESNSYKTYNQLKFNHNFETDF
jgi:hypothetical protein